MALNELRPPRAHLGTSLRQLSSSASAREMEYERMLFSKKAFNLKRAYYGTPYAIWYEVKRIFVPDVVKRPLAEPMGDEEMAWDGARCATFWQVFSVLLEQDIKGRYYISLNVWLLGRYRYIGTVWC